VTSIRRQLTLRLVLGLLLVFGLAGLVLHLVVRDTLTGNFDVGLAARAAAIATLAEEVPGAVEYDAEDAVMPEFEPGPAAEYFSLWLDDGRPIGHSDSLGEAELPLRAVQAGAPAAWDMALPDGRSGRALAVALTIGRDMELPPEAYTTPPRTATVVVAASRERLDASLDALLLGLAGAVVAVTLIATWLVSRSVTVGLAPLARLGRQVDAVDASSLDTRLDAADMPDELAPWAGKLNELLARLAEAFEKERRMTAGIAHELRTPVAELRAAADVARRWPDDAECAGQLLATSGAVAERMTAIIEAMMHYRRHEAGAEPLAIESVGLHAMIEGLTPGLCGAAAERELSVRNDVATDFALRTDRGLLAIALRNLMDNAVRHASKGGTVRFRAEHPRGNGVAARIVVSNPTDELAADDLQRLTEPFWQKDTARAGSGHGGLGLTLVASVAGVLGGRLALALEDGTFRAALDLPEPA
jgi:two-component system sensor histidine kinase QseC